MFPACLGKGFHYGIQKAWGAEATVPPPFDAAKRYAMTSPPDEDGDYVIKFEINEDGSISRMGFMYLVESKQIIIHKDYVVFVCNESDGSLRAGAITPYGIMGVDVTDEQIIVECFKIFRELVNRNLLEVRV